MNLTDVATGHARLEALIEDLTDEQARAASALPGWTRGHVLTHIANLGRALTRQVIHGNRFEMYDGGQPGRDAAIEAGAGRPAGELREDIRQSSQELTKAWEELAPADWSRPIQYRGATVAVTVPTRWREVEIHTADLGLGYGPGGWTPAFCVHLIDFLTPRVPDGTNLTLVSPHGRWSLGEGEPVEVSGDITDIAAWLAGRDHRALTSSTALPELGPWPSPKPSAR
jgi:maleylpyruvate isomerase